MIKEIICGIYKITSPTGRIYIGQSKDILYRTRKYKTVSKSLHSQPKIYNSLLKYGWDKHNFEIIEECSEEQLNCRERYWQDHYDVTSKNGMNCMLTECDGSKRQPSPKMFEVISKQLIDTATLITYNSITDAANKLGLNRRTLSKHLSGQIANITTLVFLKDYVEGQSIKEPDEGRHLVKVIDTRTKIIYNSIKEAAKILKMSQESLGYKLSGKQKNNTYFIYLRDYSDGYIHEPECIIGGKVVINTLTGEEYKNARIASESTGIVYSTLKSYLNGSIKNPTKLRYKNEIKK